MFAFLVFIMVAAVGRANEVGLLEYHFTLIRAILTDAKFLVFVLIIWLLYALKCEQFILDKLRGKDYAFVSIMNIKAPAFVFVRMLQIQIMLFVPVILYALICIWIGIIHQWYVNTIIIVLFIPACILIGAWRYERLIRKGGITRFRSFLKISLPFSYSQYMRFVLRYVWVHRKILFLTVKIFSSLFLSGMLLNHAKDDTDMRMFFLFYSFGLIGHGVLIYKIRQMEEAGLSFYRGLPVSLSSRMIQYVILYLILLAPEILIIAQMTPGHLIYSDALLLIFFGWGILILLNSLLFIRLLKPFAYLKIISGIYLMVFIAVLTGIIIPFTICLFLISVYIFYQNYYRFEMTDQGAIPT